MSEQAKKDFSRTHCPFKYHILSDDGGNEASKYFYYENSNFLHYLINWIVNGSFCKRSLSFLAKVHFKTSEVSNHTLELDYQCI